MENASKALIIAGAILLAISIIGIGMYVYQQAAGATSGIGLDSDQVRTYNEPFERYEGIRSGTEVRSLCDAVKNHNVANVNDYTKNIKILAIGTTAKPEINLNITQPVDASEVNKIKSQIKTGKKYKVDFGYDKNTGCIINIGIIPQD